MCVCVCVHIKTMLLAIASNPATQARVHANTYTRAHKCGDSAFESTVQSMETTIVQGQTLNDTMSAGTEVRIRVLRVRVRVEIRVRDLRRCVSHTCSLPPLTRSRPVAARTRFGTAHTGRPKRGTQTKPRTRLTWFRSAHDCHLNRLRRPRLAVAATAGTAATLTLMQCTASQRRASL